MENYNDLTNANNLPEEAQKYLEELNLTIKNYPTIFLEDIEDCFIWEDVELTIAESIARDTIIKLKNKLLYPDDLIIHEVGLIAIQDVCRIGILESRIPDCFQVLVSMGCTLAIGHGNLKKYIMTKITGHLDIVKDLFPLLDDKNFSYVNCSFSINNGEGNYKIGNIKKMIDKTENLIISRLKLHNDEVRYYIDEPDERPIFKAMIDLNKLGDVI